MADNNLPKTWEEFCENYPIKEKEYYISADSNIIDLHNGSRNRLSDRNLLPTEEAAEAHLAFMQLHQLRDYYRQGWHPDMSKNERVYCILPDRLNKTLRVDSYYAHYRFLTFQTKELAEEFLNNFSELIIKTIDILL